LSFLARAYDLLIEAAAAVAAALLAFVFLSIVYDVGVRTTGFEPPQWTSAVTEYALFYATMLAAPWLVRRRGHVYVQIGVDRLRAPMRYALERAICVFCIIVSLVVAWFAFDVAWDTFSRGELDIRSVTFPRWVLFAPMPPGFVLIAAEFLRILLRGEDLHRNRGVETDRL
jgi:TRAP-type C4-dicarboxylate transport system permease small subunit